jgi:hypothetical protein
MKSILFAVLVLIGSAACAQNWRFQNNVADGVKVEFMIVGVDPNNLPAANFFALLTNENDFDVRATLSLETDVEEFRREVELVIPAGAHEWAVPLGLIYWSKDWSALEASPSGTRIDLVLHEPHLTRKLWYWVYVPRQARNGDRNLYPPGIGIGNGHYFYD